MKTKKLIFAILTMGIFLTACSKDKDSDKDESALGDITVIAPDDLEEFDLLYDNQTKNLSFEWLAIGDNASYSIVFSLSDDLSAPKEISASTLLEKKLTHKELDDLLNDLGVKEYKRGEVYWAIKATAGEKVSYSETRSMKLFRFYKPFTDPRDNEVYRVCKVVDPLTGDYAVWLADNLRAKKYADGTVIDGVKFYTPKEGEDAKWTTIYGGYYTWTATVRGNTGAEEGEKVQGIAPNGWHIPTKAEWDFLINSCDQGNGPGTELKNRDLWDISSTNVGTNSVGFNMAAAGYIWEVPKDDVIENTFNTYFWTATAPKAGDIYPWNPDPAIFPTQGVTYGFNANDFGAALYPYARMRGYGVRCVLD